MNNNNTYRTDNKPAFKYHSETYLEFIKYKGNQGVWTYDLN